jgi:hypothetical protein
MQFTLGREYNMKSILRITAAGVAIASFGIASAASAATETATAEAEILAALDVTLDATRNTLDFGSIAESGAGGTVTLTPAGALTCGAGLVCSGTTETPNFDIDGEANATVNISLTSANITLTSGLNTMGVALSSSSASQVLDGSGVGTFDVGGILTVGANQAVGTYTGSLEVNVAYN